MTVKARPYRKRGRTKGWEVDILIAMPDGSLKRERKKAPVASKSAALRWGRARERELFVQVPKKERKEVPTLKDFAPRYLEGYSRANREKPSGRNAKKSILKNHLVPRLGDKKLDRITNEDVQKIKAALQDRSSKTVNNILTVLNTLLKAAESWDVIDKVPCEIRLLKVTSPEMRFYDFGEYERLVEAAKRIDQRAYLAVLLGGDAGLRLGETIALERTDVDHERGFLTVRRSDWHGEVGTPKSGRPRRVPMTKRLAKALKEHKHLRGPRVLYNDDGSTVTRKVLYGWISAAERRAELPPTGASHILRHSFCSHLAMKGVPARAIQELAGHRHLSTTQRYMHLSPVAIESAIRVLDQRQDGPDFGAILEPPQGGKRNSSIND